MLTEDENGLIEISTNLWGRDATGGENSGEVLSSNFLSEGQQARDTYTFNQHAGEEVDRSITDSGVDITYSGAWVNNSRDLIRKDAFPKRMGAASPTLQIIGGGGSGAAKALSYAFGIAVTGSILYSKANDRNSNLPLILPLTRVQDSNRNPYYVYEIKGFRGKVGEGIVTMKYGIGRINGSNFRPSGSLREVRNKFPNYLLSWNIQMITPDKSTAIMGEKYLNGYHLATYGELPRASKYPGERKSREMYNQFRK